MAAKVFEKSAEETAFRAVLKEVYESGKNSVAVLWADAALSARFQETLYAFLLKDVLGSAAAGVKLRALCAFCGGEAETAQTEYTHETFIGLMSPITKGENKGAVRLDLFFKKGEAHFIIVVSIDLSRKKNSISVKWQKCIFQLIKCFKIKCITYADRWISMISITPGDIIAVLYKTYSRIISVISFSNLFIITVEYDRIIRNIPMDPVFTKPCKDIHTDRSAVAAEYSCISIFKRNDRTVKNAV